MAAARGGRGSRARASAILAANAQDVADARANGLEAPLAARLELSDASGAT